MCYAVRIVDVNKYVTDNGVFYVEKFDSSKNPKREVIVKRKKRQIPDFEIVNQATSWSPSAAPSSSNFPRA